MIKKTYFIFLFILFSNIIISQNIFDINSSEKYASFLFKNKDYSSSYKEYKRLVELAPDSLKYKIQLIKSLKFLQKNKTCIHEIEKLFGSIQNKYPNEIVNIYIQMLFLEEEYIKCDSVLKSGILLSKKEIEEYLLAIILISKNFNKAEKFITEINLKDSINQTKKTYQLIDIYNYAKIKKGKIAFLASILSVIIPGAGKVYSNDVKNGIGIFSIIGLNAWQSYRGFSIEGAKSFYGWSFGALSTGFYIANIYGASQSAKRENKYQTKVYKEKIKSIIID